MNIFKDIKIELAHLRVSARTVRFSAIVICAALVLAALSLRQNYFAWAILMLLVVILVGALAAVRWQALIPCYRAWMMLALIMGWFVTRLLLVIVYAVVIVPIGTISRLFGKKFLERHFDATLPSYWKDVISRKGTASYLKKF